MIVMSKTKNIFISHYGKDDEHVQRLKERLKESGYDVRNSSYESNNPKYDEGRKKRPSDAVIARYLRMCVNWAGTFICLIGEGTHTRPWVNYEIEQAHKLGKPIVGIYKYGCANSVELPEAMQKYGGALIGWNSLDKLGDIMDGKVIPPENPDGTQRSPINNIIRIVC
ncbi:MAG: TIR domain-containing protein [Bacteroidales bacterium]